MIRVTVRYFNILAAYAGTRTQVVELKEGSTSFDLILTVSHNNPPAFQEVVLQDGVPSPHLRVFRNNQSIDNDLLKTVITDGDEILLFPAVAGGAQLSLITSKIPMGISNGGRGDKISFSS
jgi:MoaD family protein